MDDDARTDLDRLVTRLSEALRRDADMLEGDRAPELGALASLLDALMAAVRAAPEDPRRRRVLLQALSEVETFRNRIDGAHARTRKALMGEAERRSARLAYGEAQRYAARGSQP
jgi:hypothetical protein